MKKHELKENYTFKTKNDRVFGQQCTNNPQLTASSISGNCENREELIKKIRKKIKSGFYKSDEVNEDLSYDFAKSLDQYF